MVMIKNAKAVGTLTVVRLRNTILTFFF